MATNKVQQGDILTYVNVSGTDITSGTLVKIGELFGVALVDIAQNASGAVALTGVFEIPCELSAEVEQGTKLYFKDDTKKVTETGASNTFCGICFKKALQADKTIHVRIGYLAEAGA